MELNSYFKSIIDQDDTSIVICNLEHIIIYMNKVAIASYANRGGRKLVGMNLFNCHNSDSQNKITKVVEWFKQSKDNNFIHTSFIESQNKDIYMIALRDENDELIGYYEKHEYRSIDKTPFYEGINL